MVDYKISVVYFTYRPGGFDMLAESLKKQTYTNYELIVIDDYPNRRLENWLMDQGIPVRYYGPMKRKSIKNSYNQCNVANTALIYARGDIMILYNDYTWLPPEALQLWNNRFNELGLNTIISGVGKEYIYRGDFDVGDVSTFKPPFTSFNDGRFGFFHDWVPKVFELFYAGLPVQYLVDINGFDERADEWCVFWYDSVVEQARINKMNIVVDQSLMAHMVDHRVWTHGVSKWWHIVRTGGVEPRTSPQWYSRSINKFSIEELRNEK